MLEKLTRGIYVYTPFKYICPESATGVIKMIPLELKNVYFLKLPPH